MQSPTGGRYARNKPHNIPARGSIAVPLPASHTIKVVNTHGTQVIDFWAFAVDSEVSSPASTQDLSHHLSMSHTRASTLHLSPRLGDILVTNQRAPMLELIQDTSPGIHDTLIPACDPHRYRLLGASPDHASCATNLATALQRDINVTAPPDMLTPDPLNLFMNIPVRPSSAQVDGSAGAELAFESPRCKPGDYVVFRALMDCVVVMSACPQDLVAVNAMVPRDAAFEVSG